MDRSVVTLERFIIGTQRKYPEARGALSSILYDLTLAAKLIAREVTKAGLVDILGQAGRRNIHGEDVKKLDVYANEVIFNALDHTGLLCLMASEEEDDIILIPERFDVGDYVLLYDPLDGSSNIDANISIGTIFSIHSRVTEGRDGTLEDCLQKGSKQVCAGYVMYGSSTMLVYTTGDGVHTFTLDPSIGEFLLSDASITIPTPGKNIYSVNEGNFRHWSENQKRLARYLIGAEGEEDTFSMRYVGSLVADFHRTLSYGGLFMYPADEKSPDGKLRLLYEAAPLAMICEQAGGLATNGVDDILDIQPTELHQRTPLFMGSRRLVEKAHSILAM